MSVESFFAVGKVDISKEKLLKFISYTSWISPIIGHEEIVQFQQNPSGIYAFRLIGKKRDETIKCLRLLNELGEIQTLLEDYVSINTASEFRITGKKDTFVHYDGQASNVPEKCHEGLEHYITFRNMVLSEQDIFDDFVCAPILEKEQFFKLVRESETIEKWKENLQQALSNNKDKELRCRFGVLQNRETEIKLLKVSLNYDAKKDEFSFRYSGSQTDFIDPKPFSMGIEMYEESHQMIHYPSSQHRQEGMEVQWDFLKDGEPWKTILSKDYAQVLFATWEPEKIKIYYENEWVPTCSVCINRLKKEVAGCHICELEVQK